MGVLVFVVCLIGYAVMSALTDITFHLKSIASSLKSIAAAQHDTTE
jgi:hypothetical protein